MKNLFNGLALFAVALVLIRPLSGVAQTRSGGALTGTSSPAGLDLDPEAPIDVTGDTLGYDAESGWAEASGNVKVTAGTQTLRADQVRVNLSTGELEAAGGIVLDRGPAGVWRGETLSYNMRTGEGITTENVYYIEPFHVRALRAARTPDEQIRMEHAVISTCTNAPGHEHYSVSGRRVNIKPEDNVSARGVTIRFLGLPIMYMPYWYRGLRGDDGWRFDPGYSRRMGAFLLGTYRRRLFNVGEEGQVRSRTRVDGRTKRGFALGQDLVWQLPNAGDGEVSIYGLDDQDPAAGDTARGDDLESSRYRLHAEHTVDVSPSDRIRLQASYFSDRYMLEDFYEDDYRRRRQPDNFLSWSHTKPDYAAGGLVRLRLNSFYEQVEQLPELWFDQMRRETLYPGLYHESQNRLAFLNRRFADGDERDDYDAMRLDSKQMLFYPFKTAGFLTLVPRAGVRGTYYSDTLRTRRETETVDVVQTNELGQVAIISMPGETREWTESAGSGLRTMFEVGLEASFKAYRTFDAGGQAWRHVVEPYANYTLVPEPNLRPHELPRFDAVDELDEVHQVAVGTRHLLQTRRGRRTVNVADVDIYTAYRIARESGEDPVDFVHLDTRLRPSDWLQFDSRSVYSLSESEILATDARLSAWRTPVWRLDTEYLYRRERNSLMAMAATFAPNATWAFNLYGRYEYEDGRLEEQGGYIQYSFDCLAMRLGGSFMPGYTRDDGTVQDDDFRVLFNVWLTHFPPENLNRRYRH